MDVASESVWDVMCQMLTGFPDPHSREVSILLHFSEWNKTELSIAVGRERVCLKVLNLTYVVHFTMK